MGFLLPALTKEKFENQRRVVLNERRQSYENHPYGMVPMALMPALFPEGHPYHWMTIGEPADLHAATLDDVRQFFSTYYHPGNASLALAGDIDSGEAFDLARRYFGEIPPGPTPPPVVVSDRLVEAAPCRLVLEDQVELPRLYLAWKTPGLFEAGDAELDMLATILASGKSSRLYQELVHDRRIATDVSVGQGSRELAGTFSIVATAAPGQSLADIEDGGYRAARAARHRRPRGRRAGASEDDCRDRLHLPAPDSRRLWRAVRPAQRLQRLCRRPRIL